MIQPPDSPEDIPVDRRICEENYTVENTRHAENRNLDLVPESFKTAVRRPEAFWFSRSPGPGRGPLPVDYSNHVQKVAPVSMLAAKRTLFWPAFNTTGTEMPSR